VLLLIRSITSTDWDDTTGRLVQPLLSRALEMRRQIAREGWWNQTLAVADCVQRLPLSSCPTTQQEAPIKRLEGSTGEATKCQRGEGLAREASRHGAQGAGVALFDVQGGEGGKRTCHRRGQ
jgi:hypothetical protein